MEDQDQQTEELALSEQLFSKMVSALSSLPGVGKKSATRIGFHLLRMEEGNFRYWIETLRSTKESLRFCTVCASLTEHELCDICSSPQREGSIICVVEQPEDVFFIETTKEFKGKYHVLGGVISPLDGVGPENLRIRELIARVEEGNVSELILATNPTMEGDATASYLAHFFQNRGIKLSRIAYGIAIGGSIEYADQYTLGKAIKSRQTL